MNPKHMSAAPFAATPILTARASTAPNIFCRSPGDTMNAGPSSASSRTPLPCGPANEKNPEGRSGAVANGPDPARSRNRERRCHEEPGEEDDQLRQVHPGRAEESTCDEVAHHDHPAQRRAHRPRTPATTWRIDATPISCAARMTSVASHSRADVSARALRP